jgi:hypothetical protein
MNSRERFRETLKYGIPDREPNENCVYYRTLLEKVTLR